MSLSHQPSAISHPIKIPTLLLLCFFSADSFTFFPIDLLLEPLAKPNFVSLVHNVGGARQDRLGGEQSDAVVADTVAELAAPGVLRAEPITGFARWGKDHELVPLEPSAEPNGVPPSLTLQLLVGPPLT